MHTHMYCICKFIYIKYITNTVAIKSHSLSVVVFL